MGVNASGGDGAAASASATSKGTKREEDMSSIDRKPGPLWTRPLPRRALLQGRPPGD
jgi:hypothetical protein